MKVSTTILRIRNILIGGIFLLSSFNIDLSLADEDQQEAEAKIRAKAMAEATQQIERMVREQEKAEAEADYKQEQEAKKALEEERKMEKEERRQEEKVNKLVVAAEKHLARNNFGKARQYAYMAHEEDPVNADIAALITRIDKIEMFGDAQQVKADSMLKAEKTLQSEEEEEDAFSRNDDRGGLLGILTGRDKRKTYTLGDVQPDREYTIDECVQMALRRSQRMKMANSQIKLAEMRVWEQRRNLLPTIEGKYELSSGKIAADSYNRHYRGQKYNVTLKQTLFDGMGTWFELRQAQTNLEINHYEREKIINEIVLDTKTAYYSLDKAIKNLDTQTRYKEKANWYYDILEQGYQKEVISKEVFLRVKGANLQANFQYITTVEDLKLAELILFQALNIQPDVRIRIKEVERPKEYLSIGLENCYKLALANRPEFKIKEKYIDYYNFERKMMKAKGYPKIEFNGTFGAAYENYEPLFLPADITSDRAGNPTRAGREMEAEWYAGVKGSVPLWGNTFEYNYVKEKWAPTVSSFRGSETATSYFTLKFLDDLAYFSNLQESKVGYERSKYEYLKAKKDLLLEVKETYFKYRKAILQVDVGEAQYEHQKMFIDILEERRRFGEMDMEKLIDEYAKLAEFEFGLISGDTAYYTSLLALNKVIGIPDYFKSSHETQETAAWALELEAQKEAEAREVRDREEALMKQRREAEEEARAKKIAVYLNDAQASLDKNDFDGARKAAGKAVELDPDDQAARDIIMRIAEARAKREAEEKIRREAEESAKKRTEAEAAAKREAEQEAERRAREEERIAREKVKAAKEQARKEAEAEKKAEEEARRKAAAEARAKRDAERKAAEEARRKQREAERAAKKQAEAEAQAKREAEREAKRKAREEERIEREKARAAKEQARREEEAKRKAEEETRRQAEAEERTKRKAEEKIRREAEKAAAQRIREEAAEKQQ